MIELTRERRDDKHAQWVHQSAPESSEIEMNMNCCACRRRSPRCAKRLDVDTRVMRKNCRIFCPYVRGDS